MLLPVLLSAFASASLEGEERSNLRPEFLQRYRATEGRPHYVIKLTLGDQSRYHGRMVLTYTNRRRQAIGAIDMDLFPVRMGRGGQAAIQVEGAVSDESGAKLRTESPVSGRLRIWLAKLLMAGGSIRLSFGFSGRLPPLIGRGKLFGLPFGKHRSFRYMYAYHPVLALETDSGWLPPPPESGHGDVYRAVVADWRVTLSVPGVLEVVAPGVQLEQKIRKGRRVMEFRGEGLRDFTFFAAKGLRRMTRKAGKVEVEVVYRQGEKSVATGALDIAVESMVLFGKLYGAYPYRKVTILFGPLPYVGGMEHSTVVVIGDYPIPKSYKMITVHEVAHQWWYLIVGNDQPSWPFLDEGLAAFSEWVFLREARGKSSLEQVLNKQLLLRSGRYPLLSPINAFRSLEGYIRTVYVDGATWHLQLARKVGGKRYLRALRHYVERYRWLEAGPEQMAASLGRDLPRGADPFLKALLHSKKRR